MSLKLYDLLRANKAEFVQLEGWLTAAEWATNKLGFRVTENNLVTPCKYLGLKPLFTASRISPYARLQTKYEDRLKTNEDRIATLERQLTILRGQNQRVYSEAAK